ncbi:ceramide synthase 2-like isoform X3 [Acanthopagrus latus]|uniref:ceramide synthase 2-like isoform X3 n=1 Tax=Acanthopagrus latus TaxID=8177 RepID=UPI00187C141D|nr:ceramide synthase 2-like isoform X3 [Acanthopagrus latus]
MGPLWGLPGIPREFLQVRVRKATEQSRQSGRREEYPFYSNQVSDHTQNFLHPSSASASYSSAGTCQDNSACSMLQTVSEWFFWERLWLPGNVSWSDLEDTDGRIYAKASQLYAALPCALCMLLVRFVFERFLATPLADVWGIRDKIRPAVERNPLLENYFCDQARIPSQADVTALCKKTSWSERRIQSWFRRRRNQERPGLRKRFCEASWRCVFYFFAFVYGVLALHDKPWFYNLKEVWAGFPKQSMLPSQYWYYMLEMGFYISLLLSLSFDVKRKDFKEQVIHHTATLTLLSFSWVSNYIRIGTIVMALHDCADILLEGAKVFNYAKWRKTANTMFVVFTALFMGTRVIIFPFWIIHCTWVYPLELFPPFFGYYFFNVMLVVLQMLHIYWAVLISRMFFKFIFIRQLEGDDRSDEDEEDSDSQKERNHKSSHKNGPEARGRATGH